MSRSNRRKHRDTEEDSATSPADQPKSLVPFTSLFRYADRVDALLLLVGTFSAVVLGVSQPVEVIFFGEYVSAFNAETAKTDPDAFIDGANDVALKYAVLGVVVVLMASLQVSCWRITASRQAKRIRSAYVGAILKQEIGWFDLNEPGQLSTRVADLTVTIQDGMGRKVADLIQFASMMSGGIIIGLVKGWELALVLLAFTPFIALSAYISMKVFVKSAHVAIDSYSDAGSVAQESLGNVRTVHMFNLIGEFVCKYEAALSKSVQAGIKKGIAIGWGSGLVFFTIFCTYACGMFYGALKVVNDRRDGCEGNGCYDGGRVLTVFFSMTMGAIALGQAGPSIEAIFSARAAAYDVFAIIDRETKIDPTSEDGRVLPNVTGLVEIDSITFTYPSRPNSIVCKNYSLSVKPGETVALVGPSGSGKSTVVSLLERFYDPTRGSVKLDGVDLRELNVKWLRQQIGLVGQEPALFATSIRENIRYGRPDASDEEVIEAAKMANAYDFIMEFPRAFDTEVGERGTQLSGEQKQRIAIARAIIKNPSVLLLDEATSALDTESERVVQASLDRLLNTARRTTIVIAHRLSTIRNADKIAVHSGGAIVEMGSHDELMQLPHGHYRLLVEAQNRKQNDNVDETMEEVFDMDQSKRVKSIVSVASAPADHDQHAKTIGSVDEVNDESVVAKGSMRRIWQMTLIVLAVSPVLYFAHLLHESKIKGTMNTKENNDADNAAGALLSESIGSIRTVASFSMETTIQRAYLGYLSVSDSSDRKVGVISGVTYGVSMGAMWMVIALILFIGAKWVANGTVTFENMYMVQQVSLLCMFAVGMAMQNLTDNAKAKKSVAQVLTILDRTPAIDATSTNGEVLATVHGDITFTNVQFAYPSRPDTQVYKNYNLTIQSGQTVALVGASGSGKSTAIALLERFYDPLAGQVMLDGRNLRSLQLPWLREQISLVSQEPVLFAGTIAENIAMGKPHATPDEIEEAAKRANALDFIKNFPEGFATRVGDRGAQVSGGQKQRIAIARAILRDPQVLLLDEATSALDSESERVVQASLDKLLTQKKRTTIIVAHRLSTIRHADVIAVTRDGEIVELGTHDELMARANGVYKSLVGHQAGSA